MSHSPQINFDAIATGVTAVLAEREATAKREAEENQRIADAASALETQRANAAVRSEFMALEAKERELKRTLEAYRLPGSAVYLCAPSELGELRRDHNAILFQRAQMLARHPFLKK
jgi:hypothetical protein